MSDNRRGAVCPGWTADRTVRRGPILGHGTDGEYLGLVPGPGEPHVRRSELVPDVARLASGGRERHLLGFVHVTDLQLADLESPGRVEFLQRLVDRADMAEMLPSYRPHEILGMHAVEAMVRTLNTVTRTGPSGVPPRFVISTGDNIDNQQWNELHWFFGLMNGGLRLRPGDGLPVSGGVHGPGGTDPGYWQPDGDADDFKTRWGFPSRPHLFDEASRPLHTEGLTLPWLSCYGNHDGLVQGRAPASPAYAELVTGTVKAVGAPAELLAGSAPPDFIADPCAYSRGLSIEVTADPQRRAISRREYVRAHMFDGGSPHGHGFTEENLERGTAYYATDEFAPARLIVLDTTNPGGFTSGSIGAEQLRWLERRLREVHSRCRDEEGRWVDVGNQDRLVVLCSHHGLPQLTNPIVTPDPYRPENTDLPRVLAPDIERLLHRYPNVVLWVTGHVHRNSVVPRRSRWGSAFWELSSSALMDWPCQARYVDLTVLEQGLLSIRTTMVDHAAPARPSDATGLHRLAAVHRELAANEPYGVGGKNAHGANTDRNVELLLPAPFPLTE